MRVLILSAMVYGCGTEREYPPNEDENSVSVQEMDCVGSDTVFRIKPGAKAHIVEKCDGDRCQSQTYSRNESDGTLTVDCGGVGYWARVASLY